MLRQLAPRASTPPSPNSSAWMARATVTATTAAHGPSRTAMRTAPTACAVVPSGTGTLSSITRKLNEAAMASRGTWRWVTTRRTREAPAAHTGTMAAPMTAQVCGLR